MARIWQIDLEVDTDGAYATFYRSNGKFKRFRLYPDAPMEKKLIFLKRIHVAQRTLLEGVDLTGNREE